jgi:pSer/pThr/pTyr-binding forkhead associated (FHA) protein
LQHQSAIGTLRSAMARLRVVSGPAAGQTVDVEEEVVIGREDTDLEIDDDELSRRHAVVRRHANRLQVEDLGSTNGTFVDGNRIAEPTLLGGGAEIKIGTTVLVVEGVLPVGSSESGRELGDVQARNVTRVSPAVGANTAVGSPQAAAAESAAAPAPPSAAPVTGPPAAQPSQPLAPFHPPTPNRQKGLASRSWLPVALSFGTVIIVAIALVIYFSQHQ